MITRIKRLQNEFEIAHQALHKEINRMFPVGLQVRVIHGRGWMRGVVCFKSWTQCTVAIKHSSGNVHHRHYKDVIRD